MMSPCPRRPRHGCVLARGRDRRGGRDERAGLSLPRDRSFTGGATVDAVVSRGRTNGGASGPAGALSEHSSSPRPRRHWPSLWPSGLRVRARLVYLAGRDRKSDLEMALTVTGQVLDVVEIYAAVASTALDARVAEALETQALDGILHFSRRSAALFLRLTEGRTGNVARFAHFCLSDDVAAPLRGGRLYRCQGCRSAERGGASGPVALT